MLAHGAENVSLWRVCTGGVRKVRVCVSVRGRFIDYLYRNGSTCTIVLRYLRGCVINTQSTFANAFNTRIQIVAVKNKWEKPATGGWFCGQVYFIFEDDANKHV